MDSLGEPFPIQTLRARRPGAHNDLGVDRASLRQQSTDVLDDLGNALQLDRQYRFGAGQAGCLSNDKINAPFTLERFRTGRLIEYK